MVVHYEQENRLFQSIGVYFSESMWMCKDASNLVQHTWTPFTIFKIEMMSTQMLFWINLQELQHIVSKPLRLVSVVISLLEQHNTPLLSSHLEVGATVFVPCV